MSSDEIQTKEVILSCSRGQNVQFTTSQTTVITSKIITNVFGSETSTLTDDSTSDKLDELTSLEREIAEMHHMEPTIPSSHKAKGGNDISLQEDMKGAKALLDAQQTNSRPPSEGTDEKLQTIIVNDSPETVIETLEEADLIAVLKGVGESDQSSEKAIGNEGNNDDELSTVGVTIEGEGEYQIMEIIDDEDVDGNDSRTGSGNTPSAGAKHKIYTSTVQKQPKEMTKEEERHLALEQIQGLRGPRKENKNRRKQDIKSHPLETTDLVSVLGADWSDDELGAESQESPSGTSKDMKAENNSNSKPLGKENSSQLPTTSAVSSGDKMIEKNKQRNTAATITSVVLLKGSSKDKLVSVPKSDLESTVKGKNNDTKSAAPGIQPQPTGFKRTRIIKRKIIWDPDAPETSFSYAQLVRPSNSSNVTKSKNETATAKTASSTTSLIKKDAPQKKIRPATPKERKPPSEKGAQRSATPKISKRPFSAGPATAANRTKLLSDSTTSSLYKRRSQTPVPNGANKKKKVSEIDRLMGDEGALNMLNSLESDRQKAAVSSELPKFSMRKRAMTISERFPKRDLAQVKRETVIAAKSKRIQKQKPSASWDYVYKQKANDEAMIIRRRSNSSYSSSTSLQRLSLDSSKSQTKIPRKVAAVSPALKSANKTKTSITTADTSIGNTSLQSNNSSLEDKANFEFAKPESKSNQKTRKTKSPQTTNPLASDMKKASANSGGNRRAVGSPITVDDKEKSATKVPINPAKDDSALSGITVKRVGKVSHIIFNTNKSKIEYTFNIELLNNFVDALQKLSTDTECHAVVITTNSPNFCQGVDFAELASGSFEKRKKFANQLGKSVKNFLQALATFPKPLVAGVSGSNVGLGVTILPLFDIVVASDKGCYEAPYAKIGQVPEGYCIWNALSKIRGTFKTKLFWLCEKLQSTDSALSGLVNKLTAPNKVNDDALATAKRLSAHSVEAYRYMKKTSIEANEKLYSTALEEEFKIISDQWISEECFENFKKFIQTGHW